MCGFVGFTNNITNSKKVLTNMMDVIAHRGPDSDGEYISKELADYHKKRLALFYAFA